MAVPGNFARLTVAVSSLVVAVCAVVVTVKVANTDLTPVKQPRVLDPTAVERQVTDQVAGLEPQRVARMECPASVVVQVNAQFNCQYYRDGSEQRTVSVTIVDDQGQLSVGSG